MRARVQLDRPVVVAVPAVGMVQVASDQVVEVVAVGDRLVAAALAMTVDGVVRAARVLRRAVPRVPAVDGEPVLVHVIAMMMVQVTVVQVVDMPLVIDGGVAAASGVDVVSVGVVLGAAHLRCLPLGVLLWFAEDCSSAWAMVFWMRSAMWSSVSA